ncbi:MAG: pilus assembly protein TadG-related protein [Terracoccus sp.]
MRGRGRVHEGESEPAEEGQVSLLILGVFAIVLVLILGGIDVTAAQLARMRLLDVTDAAALDAADSLDEQSVYEQGVGARLALTDASVRDSASAHLAKTPRPVGISDWGLVPQTGSPDGRTAVVTLSGRATLPMTGWVLESLGGGVTITVSSRARATLG